MASDPERTPGLPGSSGALIQPADVPEAWLVEAGHTELADRVDRMAGDVDLVTDLALARYEGPLWDYFSNELAKYGVAVIASWIGRGMIYERCKSKGLGGLPDLGRELTQDENEGLTGETVAKALRHFRTDVLMKNRWDSRKGATLRTYFIGQCLIRFPNIYRRWRAGEMRNGHLATDDDWVFERYHPGRTPSPENRAVDGMTASGAMSTVKSARTRKAMHLTADEWTQAEIAEELGVSEKAVERILANERGRLKKRGVA